MMATISNKDTWLVCRQKLRSQTIEGGGVILTWILPSVILILMLLYNTCNCLMTFSIVLTSK